MINISNANLKVYYDKNCSLKHVFIMLKRYCHIRWNVNCSDVAEAVFKTLMVGNRYERHCVFYGVESWSGVLEYWSGVESNFGVKKWAALPSIQTKPGHILENTKDINSAVAGVNSYQT